MKVRIELEPEITEDEVIIRCGQLSDAIINLQNYITTQNSGTHCLTLEDGETSFYIPVGEIYFFETEGREMKAHTKDKIFKCSYKLYELEEMLPKSFLRISKSTIANMDYIYSITRNLTASSVVEFKNSNKKALVSRSYYKILVERLKAHKLGHL